LKKKNGWRTEWREREEELTRFNGPGRSTSTFADSAFSLFPPIDFRRRRRSSRRRLSTLRRRLAPSTSVRLFCVDVVVVAVASETFYLSKKTTLLKEGLLFGLEILAPKMGIFGTKFFFEIFSTFF
jgi:hypothetical protein